jgi:thiol-disulfide isomerase/thioredoxin
MTNIEVILYHANWCGHCKDFIPEWTKLKEAFKPMGIKYKEYEADKNKIEVDRANIAGFPTIVIVADGVKQEYNKHRDFDTILKFIEHIKKQKGVNKEENGDDDDSDDSKENTNNNMRQRGGKTNFYEKYLKYKTKYLRLKRKNTK